MKDMERHPQCLVLQVDFDNVLSTGERIVESFAGIGADVNSALMDACEAFQSSTFHVLYSALLGRACNEVEVATWDIDGITRTATFGSVRTRGQLPKDSWPSLF